MTGTGRRRGFAALVVLCALIAVVAVASAVAEGPDGGGRHGLAGRARRARRCTGGPASRTLVFRRRAEGAGAADGSVGVSPVADAAGRPRADGAALRARRTSPAAAGCAWRTRQWIRRRLQRVRVFEQRRCASGTSSS